MTTLNVIFTQTNHTEIVVPIDTTNTNSKQDELKLAVLNLIKQHLISTENIRRNLVESIKTSIHTTTPESVTPADNTDTLVTDLVLKIMPDELPIDDQDPNIVFEELNIHPREALRIIHTGDDTQTVYTRRRIQSLVLTLQIKQNRLTYADVNDVLTATQAIIDRYVCDECTTETPSNGDTTPTKPCVIDDCIGTMDAQSPYAHNECTLCGRTILVNDPLYVHKNQKHTLSYGKEVTAIVCPTCANHMYKKN